MGLVTRVGPEAPQLRAVHPRPKGSPDAPPLGQSSRANSPRVGGNPQAAAQPNPEVSQNRSGSRLPQGRSEQKEREEDRNENNGANAKVGKLDDDARTHIVWQGIPPTTGDPISAHVYPLTMVQAARGRESIAQPHEKRETDEVKEPSLDEKF
ncbi:uncharacterized protein PADG_11960 [Paracoccidioides brasiliensis Pb18]|uniref:Uncharacterized protein n=1 Tax=Paracoccidioides brasiliensis (strain Pb18) TaxID=502780 RepID=A0A0A0HX36_PARBD|nr:uncharacterized protein PADG_11960 [Paracoccidioides brasiliensis Pb18]KGM91980.1 hypothetical protein PADG_11960 [Paracoccidioides brasiliensis Pb18]